MNKKVASSILALVLCLSIFLQASVTQEVEIKPKVYIDPKDNVFNISTTSVGDKFTIIVRTVNWAKPGVLAYEFKLYYNNTLLEAVAAGVPENAWLKPDIDPENLLVLDNGTIHHSEGFVWFCVALRENEPGETGGGILGTVTFKIIKGPVANDIISCTLELKDVLFVDPAGNPIPNDQYNVINGSYVYSAAATVYIEPSVVMESYPRNFTVDIKIRNVTDLFGWQCRLRWKPEVLKLVKGVFGAFLKDDGGIDLAEDRVFVSRALPVTEKGVSGSGTLVNVTFQSLSLGESALDLFDVKLFKSEPISAATPPYWGDANGDMRVNAGDVGSVSKAWGTFEGEPRYNPDADFNKDGAVDLFDLLCVAFNFGVIYPGSARGIPAEIPSEVNDGYVIIHSSSSWSVTWKWLDTYDRPQWFTVDVTASHSSIIENFAFNLSLGEISFDAASTTEGSCNISIPKLLMDGAFKVLVDSTPVASILTWNKTHTFIHFAYNEGSHKVTVIGELVTKIRSRDNLSLPDADGDGYVGIADVIKLSERWNWKEDR